MSPETDTVAAPTGCLVNVSSYMNGNRMQETRANNVADILKDQNISTTDVQIEILDLQGNQKPGRANTVLATGDTVQIMRKSNKSDDNWTSGTRRNGIADINQGMPTAVTMLHKLPEAIRQRTTVPGSRSKYKFHELTKKGLSFDVPFTPRSERQQTVILQRVHSAINYFLKNNPRKGFVTRLLQTPTLSSHTGDTPGETKHTHVVRVWRSK